MNTKSMTTMTTKSNAQQATNRHGIQPRPAQRNHHALLKTSLVAGTIAATLWGTNLLAWADAQQTSTDAAAIAAPALKPAAPSAAGSTTGITLSPITVDPIPTIHAPTLRYPAVTGGQSTTVESTAPTLVPVPQAAVPNLGTVPGTADNTEINALLRIELPNIPSVQIPVAPAAAPVSRSRSSR